MKVQLVLFVIIILSACSIEKEDPLIEAFKKPPQSAKPQNQRCNPISQCQDLVQYAVKECERLGMTMGIQICDGFSQTGGPWITQDLESQRIIRSLNHSMEVSEMSV